MAIWPSAVATDADLYVAKNALQTTLSTALGTGDTTVVLASATGFPVAGAVVIGNEVIFYTNVSGSSLTGCTRGADGTTAATHSVGVPVGAAVVAFHHNGLKDEIEAMETWLNTHLGRSTTVTSTEFGYLSGVTSAIQTQFGLKAPLASPTFTGVVTIPAGVSALAPGVSFAGDPDTGLYSQSANIINFVTGGTSQWVVTSSGDLGTQNNTRILVGDGTVGSPGVQFNADSNTGIYRAAADDLGLVAGGSLIVEVTPTKVISAQPVLHSDGLVGTPSISFGNDPDTGFYTISANKFGVSTGGIKAAQFESTGASDGATYRPFSVFGGSSASNGQVDFEKQVTSGISSVATTFLTLRNDLALVVVTGSTSGGSATFIDLLLCGASSSPTVITSKNNGGSPAARTYTSSGFDQKVSLASGTYGISAVAISLSRANG